MMRFYKFMKYKLLIFCLVLSTLQLTAENAVRTKLNFNRDWKFTLGDPKGAEQSTFNDNDWQKVGLPHSFSIPYFMSPDFYVGYGWYRKAFEIPDSYAGKKLFLEFEAAFQDAEIFVNGIKKGAHKGGYTGFSIEITDAVKAGKNTVAVRLNNLWKGGLAPRAGEHVFSGGIYRDVYLVAVNPVHVNYEGTFVTTPVATAQKASVHLQTEISNTSQQAVQVKVVSEILSPKGQKVARVQSQLVISAGEIKKAEQVISILSRPQLWDPDHPNIYSVRTKLLVGNKVQDEYCTQFGIRSIKFTADKGFFLNGKHVYLLGANVHQDHAGWGDAVTNLGFYRDVKMMKDAGFNFIRGSHYPHDPAFVEACDKLGVLYWAENPFWGIGGSSNTPEGYWNSSAYPTEEQFRDSFETSIKRELRELIRSQRNNPSVVVWSMSNEPFFTDKKTEPAMRNLLKELVDISHQEDPTRPAAVGGAQRPFDDTRIDKIGDVAGYNGDGGTVPAFQNPGIPSVVSEYGSTTAERPGKYEPGWGDLSAIEGKGIYPWRSGQAIWCGFDHGSIAGSRLGKMGIVDYFRIPKRAWYWYRNEYAHIAPPVWPQAGVPAKLRLEADRKVMATDGTEDVKLTVTVLDANGKAISNNAPVELKVISGPAEFPTGSSIFFEEKSDIRILDGVAAIECRAWYAGTSVIRATSPGLESAELTLRFVGGKQYIDGQTPKVTERPYVRFSKQGQPNIPQEFGPNNPTFSSTFTAEHPKGAAADGNEKTWWEALSEDKNPGWTLDTEKKLQLQTINLTFPEKAAYQFVLEVSEDGSNWKTVEDLSENTQIFKEKLCTLPNTIGGLVRLTFKDAKLAKLSEIAVTGLVIE